MSIRWKYRVYKVLTVVLIAGYIVLLRMGWPSSDADFWLLLCFSLLFIVKSFFFQHCLKCPMCGYKLLSYSFMIPWWFDKLADICPKCGYPVDAKQPRYLEPK
jgi:hypothetical protein